MKNFTIFVILLPALMAKGRVSPDAAFKETPIIFTVFCKLFVSPLVTVLSTGRGIQRTVQIVTAGVTKGFQFGLNIGLRVLQVCPRYITC